MSYCVRCGVRLADHEDVCPLCGTKVVDPGRVKSGEPLFVDRIDEKKHVNRRFFVLLLTVLLGIALLATVIVNLAVSRRLDWSLYVLGGEIVTWAFIALPLELPRVKPYVIGAIDTAVVCLYLLLIEALSGTSGWAVPLGIPLTFMTGTVILLLFYIARRQKLSSAKMAGWSICALAMLPPGTELIVRFFLTGRPMLSWSLIAALPMLVIGVAVLIVAYSDRLREKIVRRLFF